MENLRNLSPVDFVGLEEEEEHKPPCSKDAKAVLAFVTDFATNMLAQVEEASKTRKNASNRLPAIISRRPAAKNLKNNSRPKSEPEVPSAQVFVTEVGNCMISRSRLGTWRRNNTPSTVADQHIRKISKFTSPGVESGRSSHAAQVNVGRNYEIFGGESFLAAQVIDGKEHEADGGNSFIAAQVTGGIAQVTGGIEHEAAGGSSFLADQVTGAIEQMDIGDEGSGSSSLAEFRERKEKRKRKSRKAKSPKQRAGSVAPNGGSEQVPPLPERFRLAIEGMGGTNPVLVLQKALFKSDLEQNLHRLTIPERAIKNEFMTNEEKALVETRGDDGHWNAIDTMFLDPNGKEWTMPLRRWVMGKKDGSSSSTKVFVLNDPWIKMAKKNEMVVGDVVQLWAFRVGQKLGLALVKLR